VDKEEALIAEVSSGWRKRIMSYDGIPKVEEEEA
jgi:hypothetical protein